MNKLSFYELYEACKIQMVDLVVAYIIDPEKGLDEGLNNSLVDFRS